MTPVGRLSKLLAMAVALTAFVGITAQAAPVQNKAVVRGVRGTANYTEDRGANWKKLNVGATLRQGATIRTAPGSTVDLFLGDNGPVVRVTEDTTLGLDQLTVDNTGPEKVIETQLDLRNGRILGNVKKLAKASKYEVKTPQGVAGIRGTKYDISANGRVAVIEGEVVVVYIVGGQPTTVTVPAGNVATPPTQAGGQATLIPLTPEQIRQFEQQLDSVIVVDGTTTTVVVPTLQTVTDAQGGDPVKNQPQEPVESPISPGGAN